MTLMATLSAAILFGYLAYTAKVFGIPSMVSDTFYQLSRNGWIFSVVLFLASLLIVVVSMRAVTTTTLLRVFVGSKMYN